VRQHAFENVIDWNLDNALQNQKHGYRDLLQQEGK
jgi:hypothetical protein